MDTSEKRFEQDIETYLLSEEGGYIKGSMATYDKVKAIDLLLLKTFIANTQPKEWERFCKMYGDGADKQLYKRFDEEVQAKGLIHVLRYGVRDRGIDLKFCYFAPPSGLNPDVVRKYNSNILTCTRQFYYSAQNNNSIDMVLSLNGIPIVAIELKNQLKGQCVENAKVQFMHDRDPKELLFHFNRRILVYFAADLYEVWMTTKLDKEKTFFLPFNQGSNGAGNSAQLMAKEGKYATLRLPSGEMRMVPLVCRASIGTIGNGDHNLIKIGKAGRKRHMGIRPTVRGSVMNPNDHPHGGGEGRAPIGRPGPSTPWGKPALGLKTRKKKASDKLIVRRRDGRAIK